MLTDEASQRLSAGRRLVLWMSLAPYAPFLGLLVGGALAGLVKSEVQEVILLVLGAVAGGVVAHLRASRVRASVIGDELRVVNFYRARRIPRTQIRSLGEHTFFLGRGAGCLTVVLAESRDVHVHASVFSSSKQHSEQEGALRQLLPRG